MFSSLKIPQLASRVEISTKIQSPNAPIVPCSQWVAGAFFFPGRCRIIHRFDGVAEPFYSARA
jgi:hypothetical protein